MGKIFAMAALAASLTTGVSAFAQSVPEGQSCGGLLCDVGVFGHKVDPAPKAPPPVAAKQAEVAPAAEPQSATNAKPSHKRKRVVKTAPAMAKAAPVEKAQPVATARVVRPAVKPTKAAATALPLPSGWGAIGPTPIEEAMQPASTPSAPVADAASSPSVNTVAAQTPVTVAAPATAVPAQASPILDPFSNIPSKQPFQPLY